MKRRSHASTHLLPCADIATNKVAFRLLGMLSGYIGLRGRVEAVGDTGDTVVGAAAGDGALIVAAIIATACTHAPLLNLASRLPSHPCTTCGRGLPTCPTAVLHQPNSRLPHPDPRMPPPQKVLFEPPVLSLGPLHFRIGRDSDVVLSTTYLDERVRLGKGSRGSLFVFTRGGAADDAGGCPVVRNPSGQGLEGPA
jgi:hypothetical protein